MSVCLCDTETNLPLPLGEAHHPHLPLPLGEGRGEGAFPSGTQRHGSQPQTWLGAAHAAPPDVRSGHRGLRSLDTGWRSAILAALASDAGEPARAAPRGIHLVRLKTANTQVQTAAPNLSLGERVHRPFPATLAENANRPFPLSRWERAGLEMPTVAREARVAFTLVELLVVIAVVAMLAALVTPAVFNARRSAQNAAIKAEIDMLHMAIMHYKSEYGSFPPAVDTTLGAASPAGKHVLRVFPRCTPASINAELLAGFPPTANPTEINIDNAIRYWLMGYTSNPTSPLTPTPTTSRKKLFDFDESRVDPVTGAYHPPRKSGSPYVYLPASQYSILPYTGGNNYGAMRQTSSGDSQPFYNAGQDYFNPDTFQILCAGFDETFGTADDLSNFWPGTRQNYLDSLK